MFRKEPVRFFVITFLTIVTIAWIGGRLGAQGTINAGQPVSVTGIQATAIPEEQGGGQLIHLYTAAGIFGPIRASEGAPEALAVRSERRIPQWPGAPCFTGQYVASETHLYVCTPAPGADANGMGTKWRRIAWDGEFEQAPAPQDQALGRRRP